MKSHRKCDVHCFFVSYQHFVLFHNVKTVLFQKFENANLTQRHIVTNALFRTIFLFCEKNIDDITLFSRERIIFVFSLFSALVIVSDVPALAVTKIFKTLQFLRRHCRFHNMRQKIEIYIKKCFNCQKNKHNIYKKYEKIQYQKSFKNS